MSKGSPIVIINMGPSINNIGNLKGGEESKIGQIADGQYKKTANKGEGVVKNLEKLPTSFMDGPHVNPQKVW